jgi:RNA polymerase sigma-70 factor (ECF subfamily)
MTSAAAPFVSNVCRLTRGLAAGDEQAFREFHAAYFDRLHRYLLVVAHGDVTLAADALQETFCRAARHARVFHDETAFWDWLAVLGRSAVKDGGRKQSRYRRLLSLFHRETTTVLDEPVDEPLLEALDVAVRQLNDEDRQLIQRKYDERATSRQIAVAAGTTESAVESRLVRVRRLLRSHLLNYLRHEKH